MRGTPRPEVRRGRDELIRRASAAGSVEEVFEVASRRLRTLIPHDAAGWLMADPETGLPAGPTLIEGVTATAESCSAHWRHEFLGEDVNLFRELARADVPAAALRRTASEPDRSPRYRHFLRPHEFIDELRAVLRVGDTPWATVTLWRRAGRPPFSRAETALLASLSAPLGTVLRDRARSRAAEFAGEDPAEPHPGDAGVRARRVESTGDARPGLLIFDADGHLASADGAAAAWLELFPADDMVTTHLGLRVPIWLLLTVIRAREGLGSGAGFASSRARTRDGRWMLCHASATRAADGTPADTALVIEPASPSQLAPMLAEAYELTAREQEVTRLIARGLGTAEIAGELFLSPHTVKDHVRSILAKVGVATRGELVATLFADLYEPAHLTGNGVRRRP